MSTKLSHQLGQSSLLKDYCECFYEGEFLDEIANETGRV